MITTFQIVASHYFDITDMWIRRKSIYSLNIKYLNMVLTLHYFPSQARGEAIRLILEYGKIPFENVIVPYQWDEIKASGDISPFGQLPTLRLNSGVVIAETNAIIRYVAKLAGIYPADVDECAQADMLLELATSDLMGINPIFNRYPVDGPEFGVKKGEFSYFCTYMHPFIRIYFMVLLFSRILRKVSSLSQGHRKDIRNKAVLWRRSSSFRRFCSLSYFELGYYHRAEQSERLSFFIAMDEVSGGDSFRGSLSEEPSHASRYRQSGIFLSLAVETIMQEPRFIKY